MKRFRSERGGGGAGLVIFLLVALFVGYEVKQFGPPLFAQFQFLDAVIDTTKFSRAKTAGVVMQEVLKKSAEYHLPISRDMIKITRQPTRTRIKIRYEFEAEWLPGRPYKWTVEIDEESMLF
jgi:hypothetical protein